MYYIRCAIDIIEMCLLRICGQRVVFGMESIVAVEGNDYFFYKTGDMCEPQHVAVSRRLIYEI